MSSEVRLTVLMVAEKPSIAETLARVLSDGKSSKRKGLCGSSPVHEYDGSFKGFDAHFRVTATTGHIFSLNYGKEYEDWNKHPPKDLFHAPTVNTYDGRTNMPAHLANEAKDCHALVLWLDCDREGENICFEVMGQTMRHMDIKYQLPGAFNSCVYRAQFSSLAAPDLKHAMDNLSVPDENLSKSVETRQELDLRIGIAFSRFQTLFFRQNFGKQLGKPMVTYGPCQTPTLWFCVHRHDEIQRFVPKPFWTTKASIEVDGAVLTAAAAAGSVFTQPAAIAVLPSDTAKIVRKQEWESFMQRPLPLNTVELLKKASRELGLDPGTALHCAEQLYLKGLTSYPRTETNSYAENFDIAGTFQVVTKGESPWGSSSLKPGDQRTDGFDAGDHPPITPVKLATRSQCGPAWPVYELIVNNFLQSLASDAKFKETEVTFEVKGKPYKAQCSRLVSKGWTAIGGLHLAEITGPVEVERLQEGQAFNVREVYHQEGKTAPPGHLTESELLGLMESHGIGTDASMASHVSNVVKRNYVELQGAREMVPTPMGQALIHALELIDNNLVLPSLRSGIETECDKVAKGTLTKDAVLKASIQMFEERFDNYTSKAYFLPLMLAVALSGKSIDQPADGGNDEDGTAYAQQAWNNAVQRTASVSLSDLLTQKGKSLAELRAASEKQAKSLPDEGASHTTEEWVTRVQSILEKLGFGPAAGQGKKEAQQQQQPSNPADPDAPPAAKPAKGKGKKGRKGGGGGGGGGDAGRRGGNGGGDGGDGASAPSGYSGGGGGKGGNSGGKGGKGRNTGGGGGKGGNSGGGGGRFGGGGLADRNSGGGGGGGAGSGGGLDWGSVRK